MMRAARDYFNRMMTSYRNKGAGQRQSREVGLGKPVKPTSKSISKRAIKKIES